MSGKISSANLNPISSANLNPIGSAKLTHAEPYPLVQTMELPEEILSIIREYAKPQFKYFREYNRARKLLRVHSFENLKKSLLKTPERILPLLERLEYCDVEFHRVSLDFQKRYLEYIVFKQVNRKRQGLYVALDKLQKTRDELYRITYQN